MQCDQALLVEGDWRWRCLHETSFIVQRMRNPLGQGCARPGREHALRCFQQWGERGVGMRTCGPWDCGPETSAARMPRERDGIAGTNNPGVQGFSGRGGAWYPAGCATIARTQRTVQEPGRPSPLLEATPVLRRAGAWSPAPAASAGARVVGPRGPSTSARHEGGRWPGEPEPRLQGAGSRRAA
jgi:hypothetical protein